jgi:urease accessory protein
VSVEVRPTSLDSEALAGLKTSDRQHWQGSAQLTYSRQASKTILHNRTQAPLKVQRPFYPEGDLWCHTVLLHTAGGMVGGDRLHYALTLEPETQALVTTAAAAKIYSDHPQALPAEVTGQVHVGPGAQLEWVPQEAIVFEGARYHQTWRVDLEPDATWLGWDMLRLGRTARGERFERGEVRSQVAVYQQGQPVWIDPQGFIANSDRWRSIHGLASCPVIGTLAWVGKSVEPAFINQLRDLGVTAAAEGEMGVSRLQSGLVCRYRGPSTSAVRRWFEAVRQAIRQVQGNASAVTPRVWQR